MRIFHLRHLLRLLSYFQLKLQGWISATWSERILQLEISVMNESFEASFLLTNGHTSKQWRNFTSFMRTKYFFSYISPFFKYSWWKLKKKKYLRNLANGTSFICILACNFSVKIYDVVEFSCSGTLYERCTLH